MQPTSNQHDAIHIHDKNLIVVAGAGSGKTHVLVERYLRLLENNPDWPLNALVAITFTREAALEMRHRVRLELETRARTSAGDHWARHLARMDSARIDTIHGLCADILRANAAQAGIDPKFEVTDETEAAILLGETVDDVLATIKAPHANLFARYDADRIIKTLNRMDFVNGQHPPIPDDPEALYELWLQQWSEDVFAARERLSQSAELHALAEIDYLPAGDRLSELVEQYREYMRQVQLADAARDICLELESCRREGAVGNKGSVKAWGSRTEKDEAAILLRHLRASITDTLKDVGDYPGALDRATAQVLPIWYQLLCQVRAAYRDRKDADALLDFDDLERLTVELLADPAVRQRYRNAEFKHLLVDEFQDTNEAQVRIVRALADLQVGGTLFVVGDPKQSIYQFRGADVSVFNRVRDQIAENDAGQRLELTTSFRSHPKLVGQYNALFECLLTRDENSPVKEFEIEFGQPMHAFRDESPEAPAIEVQLLDKGVRDATGEYILVKSRRRKEYPAEDMRRWEAYEIAQRIKTWVSEQRPVFDKNSRNWRGMKYGDIAILFQAMSNVTLYEDVFKSQEIPFLTVAGRGYYDRQEVWDMLALLQFLHNPADDLSLATVLRSPIFAFSDDLLFALRLITDEITGAPIPLWDALPHAASQAIPGMTESDRPLVQHAYATLSDLRRIAGRVTISELLRRALAQTNYLAILTGLPDGARRRGNIEKLLQLAEDSGKVTLGKFSLYLADLSAREVREGEAPLEPGDAARLMTVHASKGLEFPLVILADASWERRGGGQSTLLADPKYGLSCQVYDPDTNKYENGFAHRRNVKLQKLREAAERKRLLYVAATRAQDYLLVSGQIKRGNNELWSADGWLGQLVAALEIGEIPRQEQQPCEFAGESISVRMPPAPPPPAMLSQSARPGDEIWSFETTAAEHPPAAPPLLAPLPHYHSDTAGHITATQIAYLGEYIRGSSERQRRASGQRFRDTALHGQPPPFADVTLGRRDLSPRLIGDIVHELLQYGNFVLEKPSTDDMIKSIAWGRGVTNPGDLRLVLNEVRDLLALYPGSPVYQWIESARAAGRPSYTELPFIFRTDKRVIHGVMDVLLLGPDGDWMIIDYKTSEVIGETHEQHANRYRLQLGVYAAAVREQLGLDRLPGTFIHYIRGNVTVALSSEDCIAELKWLESAIGELVAHDN